MSNDVWDIFGRNVCGYAPSIAGWCCVEGKGLCAWIGKGDTADGGTGKFPSREGGRGDGSNSVAAFERVETLFTRIWGAGNCV